MLDLSADKLSLSCDQARELRAMFQDSNREPTKAQAFGATSQRQCQSLAIASGKGGVGKSVIALNLAVTLAQRGDSVCLLDASSTVGHLELLCGQTGYWNLSHVIAGIRQLDDIILNGPCGVRIVPGLSELSSSIDVTFGVHHQLMELETLFDWLIIDTPSGPECTSHRITRNADRVLVVTTPEPTAITEAYATLKSLSRLESVQSVVLVNEATSVVEADQVQRRLQTATRIFFGSSLHFAGFIPRDAAVAQSVAARRPLMESYATCPASLAFESLAKDLSKAIHLPKPVGFFSRLFKVDEELNVLS